MRAGYTRTSFFSLRCGFTLIESLIALMVLGLMAVFIVGLYSASLQNIQSQRERMETDALLRGKVEELLATSFNELPENEVSKDYTVRGTIYTLSWKAPILNISGDSNPQKDIKEITVKIGTPALGFRSLITLRLKGGSE